MSSSPEHGRSGGWIVVCLNRIDRARRYVGPFTALHDQDAEQDAREWAAEMTDANSSWEYMPMQLQRPPTRQLPWRREDLTTEEDVERDTIRGRRHA